MLTHLVKHELLKAHDLGLRQTHHRLYSYSDVKGACAVGILHLSVHGSFEEAYNCCSHSEHIRQAACHFVEKFELTRTDTNRLMYMNDTRRLTFEQIAKKL